MNKGELLEELANKSGVSKADVAKVVDAFTTAVTGALKKDDSVVLVGFGTFQARQRAARTGRNPQTGAAIKIAASRVPAFKAGARLKAALN